MQLFITRQTTPIGEVVAWRTERGLVALGFSDGASELRSAIARWFENATEVVDREVDVGRAIDRYFAGSLDALGELEVDPRGTALQLRIWTALRRVPAGTTTSYGQLASEVGTSPRVIANAMAANPVCLALPCHRVIRGDGRWDGYAYGNHRKRWLLDHEAAGTAGARNKKTRRVDGFTRRVAS